MANLRGVGKLIEIICSTFSPANCVCKIVFDKKEMVMDNNLIIKDNVPKYLDTSKVFAYQKNVLKSGRIVKIRLFNIHCNGHTETKQNFIHQVFNQNQVESRKHVLDSDFLPNKTKIQIDEMNKRSNDNSNRMRELKKLSIVGFIEN